MSSNLIALISDLGEEDYFVGAMKGAVFSVNPEAKIVDITHQIPKHDVRTSAFILYNAARTFPKGSIFVGVVDPGVGTERRCILLRTKNGLSFIGPDNGLFSFAAEEFGVEEIREVSNRDLMREEVSSTFHGRDIMAPVAAHLSRGVNPSSVGPEVEDIKKINLRTPRFTGEEVHGHILMIDNFGNLVTNIEGELITELMGLGDTLLIKMKNREFKAPFVETFGEVPKGEIICYVGSTGFLEVAKNQGDLARGIDATVGDRVNIKMAR